MEVTNKNKSCDYINSRAFIVDIQIFLACGQNPHHYSPERKQIFLFSGRKHDSTVFIIIVVALT